MPEYGSRLNPKTWKDGKRRKRPGRYIGSTSSVDFYLIWFMRSDKLSGRGPRGFWKNIGRDDSQKEFY